MMLIPQFKSLRLIMVSEACHDLAKHLWWSFFATILKGWKLLRYWLGSESTTKFYVDNSDTWPTTAFEKSQTMRKPNTDFPSNFDVF